MWTPGALASEARPWQGQAWRLVEAQARVSTMKLVDSLAEQDMLERIIDRSKPKFPPSCAGLDFLLFTPFRYWPYPTASRFRRAGQTEGCFYGATTPDTAVAETAFYRWLFFSESPEMKRPDNALEFTAFSVQISATQSLDLTSPPLDRDGALWRHLTDYRACQDLADAARGAGVEVIRYASVRDPQHGTNLAILTPAAFASKAPDSRQTWRLFIARQAIQAFCEMPRIALEFPLSIWADDPRVQTYLSAQPVQGLASTR